MVPDLQGPKKIKVLKNQGPEKTKNKQKIFKVLKNKKTTENLQGPEKTKNLQGPGAGSEVQDGPDAPGAIWAHRARPCQQDHVGPDEQLGPGGHVRGPEQ